jgi:hypothetical protein
MQDAGVGVIVGQASGSLLGLALVIAGLAGLALRSWATRRRRQRLRRVRFFHRDHRPAGRRPYWVVPPVRVPGRARSGRPAQVVRRTPRSPAQARSAS